MSVSATTCKPSGSTGQFFTWRFFGHHRGIAILPPPANTSLTLFQEKRLERQEEEAKAQRREAARRRTRDLLLERAKQRLLAVSTTAASVASQVSSSNSTSKSISIAVGSCGKGPIPPGAVGGDDDSKGSAGGGVSATRGGGVQGGASATGTSSSEGGVGATTAITLAALSAGIPLYAQETWAARQSKVRSHENHHVKNWRATSCSSAYFSFESDARNKTCGNHHGISNESHVFCVVWRYPTLTSPPFRSRFFNAILPSRWSARETNRRLRLRKRRGSKRYFVL